MEQHFLGGELFDPGFGNQLSKIVRRERVDGNQGFQDVQVAHGSTRGGMGTRHFSQRGNGRVEKYWRKWRRGRPLRASCALAAFVRPCTAGLSPSGSNPPSLFSYPESQMALWIRKWRRGRDSNPRGACAPL